MFGSMNARDNVLKLSRLLKLPTIRPMEELSLKMSEKIDKIFYILSICNFLYLL